jgi:hypothetical protein
LERSELVRALKLFPGSKSHALRSAVLRGLSEASTAADLDPAAPSQTEAEEATSEVEEDLRPVSYTYLQCCSLQDVWLDVGGELGFLSNRGIPRGSVTEIPDWWRKLKDEDRPATWEGSLPLEDCKTIRAAIRRVLKSETLRAKNPAKARAVNGHLRRALKRTPWK